MASVEFLYNQMITLIQCNQNDKMKDIIKKLELKIEINKNKVCFLYSGNKINEELTFDEIINQSDRQINKMKILIQNIEEIKQNLSIKKSNNIICPKCKELAFMKIENYKINLFGCKNGHKINGILLNEFENTQLIDFSKIICDNCQKCNKSNTSQNIFYRCINCKMNLCILCKLNHDKSHLIIDYDKKEYICNIHNEAFMRYCNTCNSNICLSCEPDHQNHNTTSIMPNLNKIKNDMKELKETINTFNENLTNLIKKLYQVQKNLEIYYNIFNDIIKNCENKNRNYEIFQNIIQFNNNIIENIKKINHESDIMKKLNNIFEIYHKMNNEDNIKNGNEEEYIDPSNIKFISEITTDSFGGDDLSNSFSVFKSVNHILCLIYSNEYKSIICYDLNSQKLINKIKEYHKEYISNIRHFLDINNKRDLILSSSFKDNNIKVLDLNNWSCIVDIPFVNYEGYLNSSCIINVNNLNYIISSNCNFLGDSEPIKIFDFNGYKIGEINYSNEQTFFIDTYNDNINKKVLILIGNKNHVKSYDFQKKIIINKFYDAEDGENGTHSYIIVITNKLIESCYHDGKVRIWNLYSGLLLKKIKIYNKYLRSLCLLNKDYLIAGGSEDKSIIILDLNKGSIIKTLIEHKNFVINLRIINHKKYGKCLLSQGFSDDQIKLWKI